MPRPDEDDEEDLRAYASVFARLTSGSPPTPPRRSEQLIVESRHHVIAAAERLRRELGGITERLRERSAGLVQRMRTRGGALARWRPSWQRAGVRPPLPPREPSIFVGLASFAFAFGVAWWTGGPTDDVRERRPAPVTEQAMPLAAPVPPAAAAPATWDGGQVLRARGASEAAQLAVVDELMKDSSDDATKALIAGIDADSVLVSMACLRALAGRSCDTVASPLARRLDDPLWQRRAWAARVLGSNDCSGSGRHLTQRLAVEPDARVQAQLKLAIESLKEPGA